MKTSAPTARLRLHLTPDGFSQQPGPGIDAQLAEDVDQLCLDGLLQRELRALGPGGRELA